MKTIPNMAALSTTSEEQLATILEHAGNAKLLWDFFHNKGETDSAKGTSKGGRYCGKGGKSSGRPFKKGGYKR